MKTKTKHITRSNKYYGWTPDLPDHRDLIYKPRADRYRLPSITDFRPMCPPVYDQGNLGSCTANAIAAAFQFEAGLQTNTPEFTPSRLFIYYNERVIEGTVSSDSGAMIRDGIKTVAKQGVCPEPEWPYAISKFAQKPPAKCYTDALLNQALKYRRILPSIGSMRYCLGHGKPFVFGFTVYESFESNAVARTGIVPMPKPGEQVLGGHAVLAVGYDNAKAQFIVRNSWGPGWGDKGYCYMPYAYLTDPNLCDDRWTISLVEA